MDGEKIAILGAGSWGTALAVHLARKGLRPVLWSRRPGLAEEILHTRRNSRYLPEAVIPENVIPSADLEEAAGNAGVLITAVPSHAFREVMLEARLCSRPQALVINGAKGIDENSLQRMSEIYLEISGETTNFAVLSGPSHAEEVCLGMPTAVVVASHDGGSAARAQNLLMSPDFRVYTNSDVTGVELGGSLKNIIALGTGIADGLGYGDNTKAALVTRGLAEIARLGSAMGASPMTFAGLAGVGDLIVTCTSMHSRNRRAGIEIGKGKTLEEALAAVRMVVEGVRTTRAARKLSLRHGVEMPITDQMYKVLFEGKNPREAVADLMGRGRKEEMEDIGVNLKYDI
ncbi:MAG: NAD(P)H-dependent glycerol-3-phosphate dehydrogenase [Peptococcaceae bacterium]|nr:NAD(P)H-dependent glycerol-3-phosphate dehydrogenase [Peptococcaceae bacterium]